MSERYDAGSLRCLLEEVRSGACELDDALARLRTLPFAELLDARVDHHRTLRTGVPEVVYGERKSRAQIEAIARELHARQGLALATRVQPGDGAALERALEGAVYEPRSRVLRWGGLARSGARVAVVCAGTSDLPVAEEAAQTLEAFGHEAVCFSDVGVAGLHRLVAALDELASVRVAIVVAGMEGALASVLGGLLSSPVIAVPTSVGYGAAFEGLAALLAMLNACAPGIGVVNIDNGFGAAALAHKIVSAAAPGRS